MALRRSELSNLMRVTTYNVVESMHKVGGPVGVGGTVGDIVAQTAHRVQPSASLIRQVANHRLLSGILASPVTSPA